MAGLFRESDDASQGHSTSLPIRSDILFNAALEWHTILMTQSLDHRDVPQGCLMIFATMQVAKDRAEVVCPELLIYLIRLPRRLYALNDRRSHTVIFAYHFL